MTGLAERSRRYVLREMRRIEGYLDPCDALVIRSLLLFQDESRIDGGGAEIGVLYGRSYFLLRTLMPRAPVLALDNFNTGRREDGSTRQREIFAENGRRLDLPVDDALVFEGDSTTLPPDYALEKVGPIRFFSVDGGHQYHHVQQDARMALTALHEGGVIAFDDYSNYEWPMVTAAIFDFLRAESETVAPFAATRKKLYVCRRARHAAYQDHVRRSPYLGGFRSEERKLFDDRIAVVHQSSAQRAAYELLNRAGLGRFSSLVYSA
ncbi:MAG: class I SAM-dependent methyltransferase [Paracoccaceae bacterium]